jgi:hypothetical protein
MIKIYAPCFVAGRAIYRQQIVSSLNQRTITCVGSNLVMVNGENFTGELYWSLVNINGDVSYGIDFETKQRIIYRRYPVACLDGVFTLSLWPTDRDQEERDLYYLCELPITFRIIKPVISGNNNLPFTEWANQ